MAIMGIDTETISNYCNGGKLMSKKYLALKKALLPLFVLPLLFFAILFSVPASAEYGPDAAAAPSGAYLKYTVKFNKPEDESNLAYSYEILKRLDYEIQEGDMLEYDVRIDTEIDGIGALDGMIIGADVIRGVNGIQDQNGVTVHTLGDLSDYCYDRWYHRVLNLALTEEEAENNPDGKYTVGRMFTDIYLGVHPMGTEEFDFTATIMYDNIVITNNGEVKLVIFQNAEDYPEKGVRHLMDNGYSDSFVELAEFSSEDIERFTEEVASREQASIEASEEASRRRESQEISREEEEAARKASEEESRKASEEESRKASLEAEETEKSDENGLNMWIVIGCVAGVALIAIVVVLVLASGSKKKKEKK